MASQTMVFNFKINTIGAELAANQVKSIANSLSQVSVTASGASSWFNSIFTRIGSVNIAANQLNQLNQTLNKMKTYLHEAVSESHELNKSLAQLSTFTNLSLERLAAYGNEFSALSNKLGVSIVELADSYQYIAQSGIALKYAKGIMADTAKGARAAYVETKELLDLNTSVINAYRASMKDYNDIELNKEILDKLFLMQALSKITVKKAISNMGAIAGLAANAGYTLDEVIASVGVLGNVMNSSMAFISFKQMMADIVAPTAQAKDVLDKYGIEITEDTIKTKGLLYVLNEFKTKVKSSEDLFTIFGNIRSRQAISTLLAGDMKAFKTMLNEMKNSAGSMEKAYTKVTASSYHIIELFHIKVKNLFINSGEMIYEVIAKIAGVIIKRTNFDRTAEIFKLLGTVLSTAIKLGYTLAEVISGIFNVVIIGITGVSALVVSTSNVIITSFKTVGESIIFVFNTVHASLKKVMLAIIDSLLEFFSSLTSAFGDVFTNYKNGVQALQKEIELPPLVITFDIKSNIAEGLLEQTKIAAKSIQNSFKAIEETWKDAEPLSVLFKKNPLKYISEIKQVYKDLNVNASTLNELLENFNELAKTAKTNASLILDKNTYDAMMQGYTELKDSIELVIGLQENFESYIDRIKTLFLELGIEVTNITDIFNNFYRIEKAIESGFKPIDTKMVNALSYIDQLRKKEGKPIDVVLKEQKISIVTAEQDYNKYVKELVGSLNKMFERDIIVKSGLLTEAGRAAKSIIEKLTNKYYELVKDIKELNDKFYDRAKEFTIEREGFKASIEEKRAGLEKSFIKTEEGKALQDFGLAQMYYSKALQYSQVNNFKSSKEYMEKTLGVYESLASNTGLSDKMRNNALFYFNQVSDAISGVMTQESEAEYTSYIKAREDLENQIDMVALAYDEASTIYKRIKNDIIKLHEAARESVLIKIESPALKEQTDQVNKLIEALEKLHLSAAKVFNLDMKGFTVKELELPTVTQKREFKAGEVPEKVVHGDKKVETVKPSVSIDAVNDLKNRVINLEKEVSRNIKFSSNQSIENRDDSVTINNSTNTAQQKVTENKSSETTVSNTVNTVNNNNININVKTNATAREIKNALEDNEDKRYKSKENKDNNAYQYNSKNKDKIGKR